MKKSPKTALDYYEKRDDLKNYGGEGLGLFALALRYSENDLDSIATSSILDGQNDKKIDILHLDPTTKTAFLMQCYYATAKKKGAKANKASDLNTAVAWAFSSAIEKVPDRIKSHIISLRDAISDGEIERVHFWYVHNLPESTVVAREMKAVKDNASAVLSAQYPELNINVESQEVGQETLNRWLNEGGLGISVTDDIEVDCFGGFETKEKKWSAFSTSISGSDIHKLYKKYELELFSLNVRDYLGSFAKDTNINNGIKTTATEEPELFWAFNNGITAIVNDYHPPKDGNKLKIEGISIVNGAQTTGAIGNLEKEPDPKLKLPIRLMKTSDPDLVLKIMRYNNSQNKVEASDFRSTDDVQRRLKTEFVALREFDYEGGRRGGVLDAIKRRPSLIPSYTISQVLTAFHGEPLTAYNQKSKIWIDNATYSKVFNEQTSAKHMVFVFTLFQKIDALKKELREQSRTDDITEDDKDAYEFLSIKGSHFYLMHVISVCMETFIQKPIGSKFDLAFKDNVTPDADIWSPIMEIVLAFSYAMREHLEGGIKKSDKIQSGAQEIRQFISSTKKFHEANFKAFRKNVVWK